jgi:hypothetical protein
MSFGSEFDKILEAPLTAHETRWGSELAEKLPHDEDLSFLEIKILARLSMEEWPAELLLRVKDYINFEDINDRDDEAEG